MNEENPEVENDQVSESGIIVEEKEFSKTSEKAGFTFYNKTYKSANAAEEDLGKDKVLDMINNAVSAAQRQRATNKLPSFEEDPENEKRDAEWQRLRDSGQTVLVSEQEAIGWKPGERDLSLQTLSKRFNDAANAYRKAKVEGADDETLATLLEEAREAKRRFEVEQAKLDDLLEL